MPTVTKSFTAISLSCLVEGLDEEAVDVENRVENREKERREAMLSYIQRSEGRDETRRDGYHT